MNMVAESSYKIMVVDDEPTMRDVLRDILEEAGYHVICASNGREGLALLTLNRVDLVITDIFMPDMDGLEFINAIRKDYQMLKILAISGGGEMRLLESLDWAKAFGAGRILKKPFNHIELLQPVREMLDEPSG